MLADLKNQADNLRLLISATEAELSTVEVDRLVARNTEAWLLTLRKNLVEVEQDSDEAFRKRRELVKLLIEKISARAAAKTDASEWISATGSRRPSPHPQQEVWMVYGTS